MVSRAILGIGTLVTLLVVAVVVAALVFQGGEEEPKPGDYHVEFRMITSPLMLGMWSEVDVIQFLLAEPPSPSVSPWISEYRIPQATYPKHYDLWLYPKLDTGDVFSGEPGTRTDSGIPVSCRQRECVD